MSETTSSPEPGTGPIRTTAAAPTVVETHDVDKRGRRGRVKLNAAAAWVGIVAGVVFVVAVIFFSGFILGAHSGGGHRGHEGGGRDSAMTHRGGPPPMFEMGPMGPPRFERPPFGPGGPGGPGSQQEQPPSPPTSAPARP